MSAKYFIDTNVLVYAYDTSAGTKHQAAQALLQQLWASDSAVLSTQVLQEFCVAVRRRAGLPLSANQTRSIIEGYLSWEIVVNTPASIAQALAMESRYQISFWDALILQAAEHSGATIVYSEDLSSGQEYGSVRVVNPFTAPIR